MSQRGRRSLVSDTKPLFNVRSADCHTGRLFISESDMFIDGEFKSVEPLGLYVNVLCTHTH